jgi:hypothetical protein
VAPGSRVSGHGGAMLCMDRSPGMTNVEWYVTFPTNWPVRMGVAAAPRSPTVIPAKRGPGSLLRTAEPISAREPGPRVVRQPDLT